MSASDNLSPDQFTTYYHGTSAKAAADIQRDGLTSSVYEGRRNMTLTSRKDEAGMFGALRAKSIGDTAVVALRVPNDQLDEYTEKSTHEEAPGKLRGLKKALPPEWVSGVDKF